MFSKTWLRSVADEVAKVRAAVLAFLAISATIVVASMS
jgi:hypothetical protein